MAEERDRAGEREARLERSEVGLQRERQCWRERERDRVAERERQC